MPLSTLDPSSGTQFQRVSQSIEDLRGLLLLLRQDVDRLLGTTGEVAVLKLRDAIKTPLATGDLFSFDGKTDTKTLVRIPVGPDTWILTADSTQASGIRWLPGVTSGSIGILNALRILLPRP